MDIVMIRNAILLSMNAREIASPEVVLDNYFDNTIFFVLVGIVVLAIVGLVLDTTLNSSSNWTLVAIATILISIVTFLGTLASHAGTNKNLIDAANADSIEQAYDAQVLWYDGPSDQSHRDPSDPSKRVRYATLGVIVNGDNYTCKQYTFTTKDTYSVYCATEPNYLRKIGERGDYLPSKNIALEKLSE